MNPSQLPSYNSTAAPPPSPPVLQSNTDSTQFSPLAELRRIFQDLLKISDFIVGNPHHADISLQLRLILKPIIHMLRII